MVKYVDSDKEYYLHEGKLEYLSLSLQRWFLTSEMDIFPLNYLSKHVFPKQHEKHYLYLYNNHISVGAR